MASIKTICAVCKEEFISKKVGSKYCSYRCSPGHNLIRKSEPYLGNKYTGLINELKIGTELTKYKYELYWPISAANSCDIIALRNDEILRIEVKTTHRNIKTGKILMPANNPKRYDILALVIDDNEIIYYDNCGNSITLHFLQNSP